MNEPFVLRNETGNVPLLFIESWMKDHPNLTAGFSTRKGGESSGPFDSMNCALHVKDCKEDVISNRNRIADALNLPFTSWTCADQVHGNEVAVVTVADKGKGRVRQEDAIQGVDALITNEKGIWLTSFYADCVPLYFFDPVHEAIGLAHAGWKGTTLKIAERTIQAMREHFNTEPKELLVAIGPSIGSCCYEVDRRVYEAVRKLFSDSEWKRLKSELCHRVSQENWLLNLKECNRQIMIKAGILPIHIELTQYCTGCNTDLFYSHRMEGGNTGRMMSWICVE